MTEETKPVSKQPRDRYPRIIIACIVISAVLIIPIFMILLVDFLNRSEPQEPPPNVEAFEQMLERPREAYQEPEPEGAE